MSASDAEAPSDSAAEAHLLVAAAAEQGVDATGTAIRRVSLPAGDGRSLSALAYGAAGPDSAGPDGPVDLAAIDLVLLHGGAQNAHTFDVLVAALGRPALAIDLPGHGSSPRLPTADYTPARMGELVASCLTAAGVRPTAYAGASVGGMVALGAARRRPPTDALVLLDVTPDARPAAGNRVTQIREVEPRPYDAFVDAVAQAAGSVPSARLRHSVWHATRPVAGGLRAWATDPAFRGRDFEPHWSDVAALGDRLHLILAERGSYVPAATAERLTRELPPGRVRVVAGAEHSVQSSRPRELAAALDAVLPPA